MDTKHDADMEKILHKFQDHADADATFQVEILKELKALREEMKPLIELYKNGSGAYNTVTWALKFLVLVSSALAAITAIIYFKKP